MSGPLHPSITELFTLLGGRYPLRVMEGIIPSIEEAVDGLDEAGLRRPEKPGKWSVMEAVWHLADTEIIYGFRVRRILAEPGTPIQVCDQDAWNAALDYNTRTLAGALDQLAPLRRANIDLFRSLGPDAFVREGVHGERGPESVDRIMHIMAGHDLVHLRQIARIRQALGL